MRPPRSSCRSCCLLAPSKRASIIDENIAVAEKQIGMLADSSETGGVIRIPSTWKNGQVGLRPVDDWVSGFFAGTRGTCTN